MNISSMAAWHEYALVGYKTTKAAVIALTENLAAANARYGVRANAILPGKGLKQLYDEDKRGPQYSILFNLLLTY